MHCNQAGLALIKEFEGCKLTSYQDQGGIWTVGYGHTGADVYQDQHITQAEADDFLVVDVAHSGDVITKRVKVPLSDNQFSALCSFVFNVGGGNFATSTLLRVLNNGGYTLVPAQLLRWDTIGGVPNAGLLRRRLAEKSLWMTTEKTENVA